MWKKAWTKFMAVDGSAKINRRRLERRNLVDTDRIKRDLRARSRMKEREMRRNIQRAYYDLRTLGRRGWKAWLRSQPNHQIFACQFLGMMDGLLELRRDYAFWLHEQELMPSAERKRRKQLDAADRLQEYIHRLNDLGGWVLAVAVW